MEYCTKEGRDFDHCHSICSNSAAEKPPAAVPAAGHSTVTKSPTAAPAATQGNCTTKDAKIDAIKKFVTANYGDIIDLGLSIFSEEIEGQFEIFFYPETQNCEGKVLVNKDCRIGDAEGTILVNAALLEQTICELDKR